MTLAKLNEQQTWTVILIQMGPYLSLLFGQHLCQWKFAAFAPRNVFGSGSPIDGDLWCKKKRFLRSSDSSRWAMITHLVHVHHIMVRGVSSATSQEKVCSPWMSNDQEAYKHSHTHIHTVSCMMSYNDEWGCDGLSFHFKFVHGVNNRPGCCPSFLFSSFRLSLLCRFSLLFLISYQSQCLTQYLQVLV